MTAPVTRVKRLDIDWHHFTAQVTASFVIGGFAKEATNTEELTQMINDGAVLSPVGEVAVRLKARLRPKRLTPLSRRLKK